MEQFFPKILKLTEIMLHPAFVSFMILWGAYYWDRLKTSRLLYVYFFSVALNSYLKHFFAIPLEAHMPQGYGFPSGHMMTGLVLYGALMLELKKPWAFILIPALLVLFALNIIAQKYHIWRDVIGGIGFGLVVLLSYSWLLKRYQPRWDAVIGLVLILILLGIGAVFPVDHQVISWSFGALVGLTFARFNPINRSYPILPFFKSKTRSSKIVLLTASIGLAVIFVLFKFVLSGIILSKGNALFFLYALMLFWVFWANERFMQVR